MTALENLKKYKSFPSTLIVNGLSPLGIQIARTLLEQKGFVIITDKYTKENKKLIDELSQFDSFSFIKLSEQPEFLKSIEKLDYLIYLDHEGLDGNIELAPNDFLKKINSLDSFLKFATDKKARVLLTTSLKTHQYSLSEYSQKEKYTPTRPAYSNVEQQRYEEKLLFDFNKKYDLDARIIRLGDIYGPDCSIEKDTTVNALIRQSLKSKKLKIFGDGLEENYIIHLNDATYGIIKALFAQNTNGEIFNLTNFEDNTTLAIAYALIETTGKAREVVFAEEKGKKTTQPIDRTPNLSKVGWKPRIELGQGLAETVSFLQEDRSVDKAPPKKVEASLGQSFDLKQTFSAISEKIVQFFFETDSQLLLEKADRKRDILDKLSKDTTKKKRVTLKKELKEKRPSEKSIKLAKFGKRLSRNYKANKIKYLTIAALSILIYFTAFEPVIGFIGNTLLAGVNGYKAVESLKEKDLDSFDMELQKVDSSMEKAQIALRRTQWMFYISGTSEESENLIQFYSATRHLVRAGQQSISLINALWDYLNNFTLRVEAESDYSKYLEAISLNSNSLELAYIELLKADEILAEINYDKLVLAKSFENSINSLREELFTRISKYKNYISVLPSVLGYQNEKTYLLIFQNDTELRSTGGFIGSYGIVRINNGSITEITIDDIYNPDGQLDIFVEPPEPLKIILGDASWAMRDANWEPDFPTAARQIEWFYKVETDRDVDGVIAINTSIIEKLLELTGPVHLSEQNTTVTAENFFDEAEKHHLTFTPGSMDKRDFLGELTEAILLEISQKDISFLSAAGELIEELLNSREIFIYLNDSEPQKVITSTGWDGSIGEYAGDFLFPVENNIGGNKVNRYVERKINGKISLLTEQVAHDITISYTNSSKTDEWPGGNYKNHFSLFIPQNSFSISSDNIDTVETTDRYKYQEISGLVNIPFNSSDEIEISYISPSIETLPVNKKVYSLYVQRQSGVEDTYLDFSISYPNGWKVTKISSTLSSKENGNTVSFYGLQNADVEITLEFSTEEL